MGKLIHISILLVFLAGCSSGSLSRRIASSAGGCYLKKHPSRDYFQIYHRNELLYEHWYDEEYAVRLMDLALKRGQCH